MSVTSVSLAHVEVRSCGRRSVFDDQVTEGQPRQVQVGNFLRNLTYLGGVLLIMHAALVGPCLSQ